MYEKKKKSKLSRWQSISESAAKQSKRNTVPEIMDVMSYKEALNFAESLDLILLPYESKNGMKDTKDALSLIKSGMSVGIIVGPEGGFEEKEVEEALSAGAKVIFHGLNIHPGSAKNKMINSQYIAMEFQSLLPAIQRPEHTAGYEGFIHLTDMEGAVEQTTLRYIIRDHDMEKFYQKKSLLESAATFMNTKYGQGTVELTIRDSYFNMREKIEPCMHIVERAINAMQAVGMTAKTVPIRGGTDGARLSFEGLPCPNLCTGGANYHGRFEFIPVEDMQLCVKMLLKILTNFE